MKLPSVRTTVIVFSAIVLYIIAYILVYPYVGLPGALAVIPIVICGWLLGQRGGFITSLLITLITLGFIVVLGDGWKRVRDTWLGLALLPIIGLAIGWFREIFNRAQAQAAALKQAQAELAHLNSDLERRVQERTEEIRRLNAALEQRVAERTEELRSANAQLEAFNSMVAHDLRAPLTIAQSYSDVLTLQYANRTLDEAGQQMVMAIQEANQQMGRLIQDLFDFSRAKEAEIQRQPLNLSDLAQAIVNDLQRRDTTRVVNWQIAPDLWAQGDERLVRILLVNLLDNAWKYSGSTAEARVELNCRIASGEETFFVSDNGIGLDLNQAEQLFQPFRRFTEDFPGTGLGLATCKRVVERHGGRIWVESQPGLGTTLYFTLPTHSSSP